jgi:DNA repair protein RecO (recombination protein O)
VNRRIDSPALLVRGVPYGESDVIATFFTREAGKLATIVRGARKSTKRFAGALEPIHGLMVSIDDKGKELCVLKEARVLRARMGIAASLEAMEAAGQALRWVRHLCPPRTPEPAAWGSLEHLLDLLDGENGGTLAIARRHLAIFGLRLLADMGYALELERCIGCGRPCPEQRAAFLDTARGGIVCTTCGGARRTVSAEVRALALGAQRGEAVDLTLERASEIVALAEEAMAAHAGFDPHA